MTYLIDTDRVIDLLSQTEDAVRLWDTIERAGIAISSVTFGEVLEGVYLGRDPESAEQTFEQFRCFPLMRTSRGASPAFAVTSVSAAC